MWFDASAHDVLLGSSLSFLFSPLIFQPVYPTVLGIYNQLLFFIAESSTSIPVPITAPVINEHVDSSSSRKLFVTNISRARPSRQVAEGSEIVQENVSHLYKVQNGNDISYIWQVISIPK